MKLALLALPILFLAACGSGDDTWGDDDDDDACAQMFHQQTLPSWRVTLSDTDWNQMEDEFLAYVHPAPYHAAGVEYLSGDRDVTIPGAEIRLKGSSSWQQAIQLDDNPKMQFVISFNEVDNGARFQGARKVDLDMPRNDQTFLQQRMSLYWMRSAGYPAQCANSARLYINDEYYGLYTNLEHQDKEFLQRVFPNEGDGDLWKSGITLETNEMTATMDRMNQLWAAQDVPAIQAMADLDDSVSEWAGEAMIGDADGYNQGRPNFMLYDHPTNGFMWLANDLDTSIDWDYLPPPTTPVFAPVPPYQARWESDWVHYMIVMSDPDWVVRYVDHLADARAHYDVASLQGTLDNWADQISRAAQEDPHKPFSDDAHYIAVQRMREYFPARAAYVDDWLACWSHGGADADGDGSDMCHDCDDASAAFRPGNAEVCDMLDNDCDGRVDNVDGVSVCE